LSAVRDCLFNIFAATPPYLEVVFSFRNPRTRHAVVTRDPIIGMIKSRRMRWARHVARMGEKRNAYRILVGKPEGK
jgi:hypothetical protein